MKQEYKQIEQVRLYTKSRQGGFQVSILKLGLAKPDTIEEGEPFRHRTLRACVEFSTFRPRSRTWSNQRIWCDPVQLLDLKEAVDELVEREFYEE